MNGALTLAPRPWTPARPFVQATATLLAYLGCAYVLNVLLSSALRLLVPSRYLTWALPAGLAVAALAAYVGVVRVLEGRWPVELRIKRIPEILGGLVLASLLAVGILALGLALRLVELTPPMMFHIFWGGVELAAWTLLVGLALVGIVLRHLELAFGTLAAMIATAGVLLVGLLVLRVSGWQLVGALVVYGVFLLVVFVVTRSLWLVLGFASGWAIWTTPALGALVGARPLGSPLWSGGEAGLGAGFGTILFFLAAAALTCLPLLFGRQTRWLSFRVFSMRVAPLPDPQPGDGAVKGLE